MKKTQKAMFESKLVHVQQAVYRFLLQRTKNKKHGHKHGVPRYVLLSHVRHTVPFLSGLYDRGFRRIFADMIFKGYNVGSHNAYGYFLVKSERDETLACEEHEKKLKAHAYMKKKIHANHISKRTLKLLRVKSTGGLKNIPAYKRAEFEARA